MGFWKNKRDGDAPVTRKRSRFGGRLAGFGLSAAFFVFGSLLLYFLFIRPMTLSRASADWPAVPCTILTSEVGRHTDSNGGATYSVDITYRYVVDGRTYTGDHYSFMGGSSSGRTAKQDAVDAHPPGSEHLCYVNPEDPGYAVLTRDLGWEVWLGLIPAVFVVLGLGGMVMSLSVGRSSRPATGDADRSDTDTDAAWLPASARQHDPHRHPGGPVRVKPGVSRGMDLIIVAAFALFWNGITGVFVGIAFNDYLGGDVNWVLTLFLIPFVLVGLFLIGMVGHAFLALFNPTVEVYFDPPAVEPGGELNLSWSLAGSTHRLRSLEFTLRGVEKATYTRGTDTITDEHVFHDEVIHRQQPMGFGTRAQGRLGRP